MPDNQPETPAVPVPDPRVWLDRFPEDGPRCPTCGTPRPPFDARLRGLLDLAPLTREAARTLLAALETEAL